MSPRGPGGQPVAPSMAGQWPPHPKGQRDMSVVTYVDMDTRRGRGHLRLSLALRGPHGRV